MDDLKPTQDWTVARLKKVIDCAGLVGACDDINAALDAVKEESYVEGRKDERDYWRQHGISAAQQPLVKLVHFLKSVIQSGESWTSTCQKQYDAALAKGEKK